MTCKSINVAELYSTFHAEIINSFNIYPIKNKNSFKRHKDKVEKTRVKLLPATSTFRAQDTSTLKMEAAVPPEHWCISTKLQGITCQKTVTLGLTTVRSTTSYCF
jgi:hypothetical protein